jgi:hypothetical protein
LVNNKLSSGRYMKYTNLTKSHLFPNKVNVNINMLYSAMLHWIVGHVKSRNVITIYTSSLLNGTMQLR